MTFQHSIILHYYVTPLSDNKNGNHTNHEVECQEIQNELKYQQTISLKKVLQLFY